MTEEKDPRPPVDSPEFKAWLKRQAAKDIDAIFGENCKPADFDERGPIFGDSENLEKTDAELFPDELEEYSPEERRKLIREVQKENAEQRRRDN